MIHNTNFSEKGSPQSSQSGVHQNESPAFDAIASLGEVTRDNEAVRQGFEARTAEIVNNAAVEGASGRPDAASHSSPAEDGIASEHNKALAVIDHNLCRPRQALQSRMALAEVDKSRLPQMDDCLNTLELEKRLALEQAEKEVKAPSLLQFDLWWLALREGTVTGVVSVLRGRIRRWEELKTHAEANFQDLLLNRHHGRPPERKPLNIPALFWGLVALISFVEVFINLAAFQDVNIGDNNLVALVLAGFFASGQSVSAKWLGDALDKGVRRIIIIACCATLLCCAFACLLRLGMASENVMTKAIYVALNLFFVAMTVGMGKAHAKNLDFFTFLRQRHSLDGKIKRASTQIEQIEAAHQCRCEAVAMAIEEKARSMQEAAKKEVEERMNELHEARLRLDGHEAIIRRQLKEAEQAALAQYRHLNHSARTSAGHPPVRRWSEAKAKLNGQQVLNGAAALVFGAMLCWGCGTAPALPETHIEVMVDRTDSTEAGDASLLSGLVTGAAFPDGTGDEWGETTVTLSPIGETSTQPAQVVKLPASKSFWERKEEQHRESKRRFAEDLGMAVDELTRPGKGMGQSYIHRNFYYRLKALSERPGRKILLSCSDLIANGPCANFYRYEARPEQLWLNRDALVAKMESDHPLPDLTGITIVNIHQPSKRHDELHEQAKRFWEHYWTRKGAKVEFQSGTAANLASTRTGASGNPSPR